MMHFHQSEAWQQFQETLGRQTFRRSGGDWEYLAVLEKGTANSRLFCPYGPSANDLNSFKLAIADLIKLGQQQQVSFIRVEPTKPAWANWLIDNNWLKTSYQKLNPEFTRLIDLTQSEEQIIAQMAQPVRNVFRNYHKKGLVVTQSTDPNDIEIFISFIHQVASRTGLRPHSDGYFQQQARCLFPIGAAKLWVAKLDEKPLATAVTFDDQQVRYYAHASSDADPQYRKLNAGTALLAEAIVEAKRQGLASFDLYGVAPENDSSRQAWSGFTKFKRSFGGHDIAYGGTWEKPLQPLKYWLYRTYHCLRRVLY